MATKLTDFMREQLNIAIAPDFANYLGLITQWKAWYAGFVPEFHEYKTGKSRKKMKLASMGMGKTVAETWASLVINENTQFGFDGDGADAVKHLIIGDQHSQRGGIFGDSKLWANLNKWSEKIFGYAGAGLLVAYVENANAYDIRSAEEIEAGEAPVYRLEANVGTRIKVKFAAADQILPISFTDDGLEEVAIVGQKMVRGKNYIHLELHQRSPRLDANGNPQYRISNIFVAREPRTQELTIAQGLASELNLVESMDIPARMFSEIWNTAKANNIYPDVPFALPMISGALPQLAQCDIAFNNTQSDVVLGKKRVFVQQDYLATKVKKETDGTERFIATEGDELYTPVPTMDEMDKNFIKEYNPTLRADENNRIVNDALGLLSFKTGLGKSYFKLDENGQLQTAYAVKTSNADLQFNVQRQRTIVIDVWTQFCRQLVHIAKAIKYTAAGNLPTDTANLIVNITFDDGALRDPETERQRDLMEVNAGIMTKAEYRVKWYGETEKDAQKALSTIPQAGKIEDYYLGLS